MTKLLPSKLQSDKLLEKQCLICKIARRFAKPWPPGLVYITPIVPEPMSPTGDHKSGFMVPWIRLEDGVVLHSCWVMWVVT